MNKGMNMGTMIGVIGVLVMIVSSIFLSGNTLGAFIDIPSLALVLVGSFFSLMIAFSMSDSLGVFSAIGLTLKQPVFNSQGIIQKMVSFSEKARREGLLALEDEL
jgi:chemotaxis protein MotA